MIEAVGTSTANLAALRNASQSSVAASFVAAPVADSNSKFFISSRVRMDNLLDIAILEFRATDTGDIIRQYPTENQIRAFQRASELDTRQADAAAQQASHDRQEALLQQETVAVHASAPAPSAPSPAPVQTVSTPAPQVAASAPPSSGGGGDASAQHSVSTLV